MTGWVVYDKEQLNKNSWFAEELCRHCSSFADMKTVVAEDLSFGIFGGEKGCFICGKEEKVPDFIICRTIFPLLSEFFEGLGVRVFNNSTVSSICNDKRKTYLTVEKSGVSILDTIFFDGNFFDETSFSSFTYPAVIKSASGHGGSEVFSVNNSDEAQSVAEGLRGRDFLLQSMCDTPGRDLRVYVMGGEIVESVLRTSAGFKSNFSLGGAASPYKLSEKERDCVRRVLSSLPTFCDFVGVDFLFHRGELCFNEIEDVVGTRMLYSAYGINAAEMYASYIEKQMSGQP